MSKQKRAYIAGPVTGIPDDNHQAFAVEAHKAERQGFIAFNPTVLPKGLEHHEYMALCLPMVAMSDVVIMLPGWQSSRGAKLEHEYALCLGKEITYPDGIRSYPGSVATRLPEAVVEG
ncbi:MAG: DUF4406 domain-containing protein [Aeromonas veronii]